MANSNQRKGDVISLGGHNSGGLFEGTSGSRKTMNIFKSIESNASEASFQKTGSNAFLTGNTFRENLLDVIAVVPINRNGFFGEPSKRKGSKGVRIVKCSDPAKLAHEFQRLAGQNYSSFRTIPGKGHIMTMKDGTIIKYRMFSSSDDGSPVVELEISGLKRVKSQKIHFVYGG